MGNRTHKHPDSPPDSRTKGTHGNTIRLSRRLVAGILIPSIFCMGILFTMLHTRITEGRLSRELMQETRMLARNLPVPTIRSFTATEQDIRNPLYIGIQNHLRTIHNVYPYTAHAYLVGKNAEGQPFLYMDGRPDSDPVPGRTLENTPPGLEQVFLEQESLFSLSPDKKQLHALYPIKDELGLIAVLILERPLNGETRQTIMGSPPMVITLLAMATLICWLLLFHPFAEKVPFVFRYGPFLATFLCGTIVTTAMAWVAHNMESRRFHERFLQIAEMQTLKVADHFNQLKNIKLESIGRFLEASQEVSQEEFLHFTQPLMKNTIIRGWYFARPVANHEKNDVESRMSRESDSPFFFWENSTDGHLTPVSERTGYLPITHGTCCREMSSDLRGFDLVSIPLLHEALADAETYQISTASPPLTFGPAPEAGKSLFIFRPVFSKGQERLLEGMVTGVINLDQALPDLNSFQQKEGGPAVITDLFYLHTDAAPVLLTSTLAGHEATADTHLKNRKPYHHWHIRPLFIFGQSFIIVNHEGPFFDSLYPERSGRYTAMAGLVITLFASLRFFLSVRHKEKLERLVGQRTADLTESEERFKTLFIQSPVPMLIHDKDKGSILEANPAGYKAYGFSSLEELQEGDFWLDTPYSFQDALHLIHKAGTGPLPPFEWCCRNVSGETIWANVTLTPILLEGKKQILVTWIDITSRRQAEEKLLRTNVLLQEAMGHARAMAREAHTANVTKSQFLANMSHELRTPLNAIMGITELIRETPLTPDQQKYAELIEKNSGHLFSIITDILDFSRLEAGNLTLYLREFNLRELLKDLALSFALETAKKKIALSWSLDERSPERVMGDRNRIRQVLENLVSNAIKFTEKGQVRIAVENKAAAPDQQTLLFSVTDTGIGIDQEKISLLFEKFSQADISISRRYGGTGLGLAICRELIVLMGGSIGAESLKGQGSRFWFQLNLEPVSRTSQPIPPEVAPASAPAAEADAVPTILIVEDNFTNQIVATGLLAKLGVRSAVASDALSALQALKEKNYDLVLMDIQMPGMDGLEATRRIRNGEAGEPTIPIIAMTAHAQEMDRRACLAAGMNGYLSKPVSGSHLRGSLMQWLPFFQKKSGPAP
ncbi:ATP-binding protein [Desulfobotulus sp. H1]|uniref:histidine kinase n=1 Tax=Desulfobotulus pelophilus TaxID=2823377 RepID=A0ABT3N627_9BACT|nr:ATP-binding protein [Desulfobotulus pelophilus]MCW7752903.1 ATP-binding protein [Desulfobotulus pelophilus]